MSQVAILSVSSPRHEQAAYDRALIQALREAGFAARIFSNPRDLFEVLGQGSNPLVVIDVVAQGEIDAFMLTSLLHSAFQTEIVLLVGPSVQDRTRGLDSGADICLSGPANIQELIAALNALWRRHRLQGLAALPPPAPASKAGMPDGNGLKAVRETCSDAWVLESRGWQLRAPNGAAVELTSVERAFVVHLFQDDEKLLRRDRWHRVYHVVDHVQGKRIRNIDVLVSRLRRKVGAVDAQFPLHVRRGVGYQFSGNCLIEDTSASPD